MRFPRSAFNGNGVDRILDADQVFGPLVDIMTALSDPANIEAWASLPDDDK
ncbi:hypothetical protein [Mycobacteroides chelonae]|uniref:hypothetical protein n=1 Tax=Mycobacteroides chelonae TaxID=1774 RepID=UPI0012FF6D8D|nr:hypothetical protein [Mycobacteroides chelonae]